ncbi:hypothetical protein LP419_26405 [Massilia sp. H-1]|nr:hypothetical protein LP419_26405 [Massilia sp. H-1]
MDYFRRNWPLTALIAIVLGTLAWACLAPLHVASHDKLFEIPKGTWARRMAWRQGRDSAADDPPHARGARRAPAAQQRHGAADFRPGPDHARPGLPPAV